MTVNEGGKGGNQLPNVNYFLLHIVCYNYCCNLISMLVQTLLERVHQYHPVAKDDQIIQAFEFAQKAHEGQWLRSGEPYVHHVLKTALVLADLKVDEMVICTALLHDIPLRTSVSLEEIKKQFGQDIGQLIEGVQQLAKIRYREDMTESQVDLLRKLMIAMTKDARVFLIKLSSRLVRMRVLEFESPQAREYVAKETKELHVEIAELLGMWRLKWQLEDLSFQYLQPEEYQYIWEHFNTLKRIRNNYIDRMKKAIVKEIKKAQIECDVTGRFKHFFSIHQKMKEKEKKFDEIYDVFALRIVTNTVTECYQILGIIHALFSPLSGRIKDYIAVPKANGYQSLHTTVYGFQGHPVEFQIRTHEMHDVALYGIAAHWQYKKNKGSVSIVDWVKDIIKIRRQTKNDIIPLEGHLDIFTNRVFVFSPCKDIIELPAGATALDFAYAVHTYVGHRCRGIVINNRDVPLDTVLSTGDTVFVVLNSYENPHPEWLSFVKTLRARQAIMLWIRENKEDLLTRQGRIMLQKNLLRYVAESAMDSKDRLFHFYKEDYKSMEELYQAIAVGKQNVEEVLLRMYKEKIILQPLFKKIVGGKDVSEMRLQIRTHNHPAMLEVLFPLFEKHSVIPSAIQKQMEESIHRILFSFTFPIVPFHQLFQLCHDLERLDDVESIHKR